MNYFFNFDSKTPNKKLKKAKPGASSEQHFNTPERNSHDNPYRENSHVLSESEYVIRKLNEASGLTPRDNISFSRYTPLPRIGETAQEYQVTELSRKANMASDTTSHIITYKFSPVQVRKPPKVSYQLSPLPTRVETHTNNDESTAAHVEASSSRRPRLQRQNTYLVKDPVIIKGRLLEYLRTHDNMCSTRVNPPSRGGKRSNSKGSKQVAKVSNSKQRLNEVKAKFRRQQEELKASGGEKGFWLDL